METLYMTDESSNASSPTEVVINTEIINTGKKNQTVVFKNEYVPVNQNQENSELVYLKFFIFNTH